MKEKTRRETVGGVAHTRARFMFTKYGQQEIYREVNSSRDAFICDEIYGRLLLKPVFLRANNRHYIREYIK